MAKQYVTRSDAEEAAAKVGPDWICPIDKQPCVTECYCYGRAMVVRKKINLSDRYFYVKENYCAHMMHSKGD